jgi:hypothetical protein
MNRIHLLTGVRRQGILLGPWRNFVVGCSGQWSPAVRGKGGGAGKVSQQGAEF